MNKKLRISLGLAGLLTVLTVIQVIAGASFDFGELPGAPPEGEANWVAWNDQGEISDGFPLEILTEDNTNSKLGENIGYSEYGDGDTNVEWWIQIENFFYLPRTSPFSDNIYFIFGGLGDTYSGSLWQYTIDQWIITESATEHFPEDVITFSGEACPIISVQPIPEPVNPEEGRTFSFSGTMPGVTYHIYRSQNASGANNGASNGQYFYIDTVTIPENKNLYVYTDNTPIQDGPAWYLVIQADPDSNAIIGCHSEEGIPTNVTMGEFTAFYDDEKSVVVLEWETVSETNIVGFNVFRGTSETLVGSVKINTAIIPAKQPGSPVGDIYTFEDADVVDGQTYYYWIEILTNDMSDQTVGPKSVTIPEPAWFYYFLPLLFN